MLRLALVGLVSTTFANAFEFLPADTSSALTNFTSYVNMFIGTASGANGASGGNNFPGAAIPYAMVKLGIDMDTVPRQAGFINDNSSVTGVSLMHDEGTGGNTEGGYGFFPLFPLNGAQCNSSFTACPVSLSAREAGRAPNSTFAQPGYFTVNLTDNRMIELTSTRRAGLIRFTFPNATGTNNVVVDLVNDLQRSFEGGELTLDTNSSQIKMTGTFLQSYGLNNYTVNACYSYAPPSSDSDQKLSIYGTYASQSNSSTAEVLVSPNGTSLSYPFGGFPYAIQAGALLSFSTPSNKAIIRFGVSFISQEQACANADNEIPDWNFEAVQEASQSQWEEVLSRVEINPSVENSTVVELLYSSLYRSSLIPANLTDENPYWSNKEPFYDALFCSWDTHRTYHPLKSLIAPKEWSEIVNAYIDGWREDGYIPECRSNTKPGYVQGGSDGMIILGDFAVKYGKFGSEFGVLMDDLYRALVDTAENTPPDWYTVGRQNTAWKLFNYIPSYWNDTSGKVGLPTRQVSRTLEYSSNDFAVRQAAIALEKSPLDIEKYGKRSMNFVNLWNSNVTSDGYTGFMQQRYSNGTFIYTNPIFCGPTDPVSHSCARGTDNDIGVYESSLWEYSFFSPHSQETIVSLMGGPLTYIERLDHYFGNGYFLAGNEPGFNNANGYHYANRPDLSAKRVRNIVFTNFGTGINGIPGNDDSAAMASLLVFHLLGLYPVVSTRQILVGSPLVSAFSLYNNFFGTTTTVRVSRFDPTSITAVPPAGSRYAVSQITINGIPHISNCWISFDDLVAGGEIIITVTDAEDPAILNGCGVGINALPDSLGTGGFSGQF